MLINITWNQNKKIKKSILIMNLVAKKVYFYLENRIK